MNEKSESTKEISKAMAQFVANVGPVYFDSQNPYYSSKYASLGQVIDVIRQTAPPLGLSWVQFPVSGIHQVGVNTMILHESGEFLSSTILVPLPSEFTTNARGENKQTNFVQEAGKYITYLRRYALASAFGLYSEEDDDGNGSTYVPKSQANKPAVKAQPNTTVRAEPKPAVQPKPTVKAVTNKINAMLGMADDDEDAVVDAGDIDFIDELSPMNILRDAVADASEGLQFTASNKQVNLAGIMTRGFWPDQNIRHKILTDLFGYTMTKEDAMTVEVAGFLKWLNAEQSITDGPDGKKIWNYSYPQDVEALLALVYEEYQS